MFQKDCHTRVWRWNGFWTHFSMVSFVPLTVIFCKQSRVLNPSNASPIIYHPSLYITNDWCREKQVTSSLQILQSLSSGNQHFFIKSPSSHLPSETCQAGTRSWLMAKSSRDAPPGNAIFKCRVRTGSFHHGFSIWLSFLKVSEPTSFPTTEMGVKSETASNSLAKLLPFLISGDLSQSLNHIKPTLIVLSGLKLVG